MDGFVINDDLFKQQFQVPFNRPFVLYALQKMSIYN